MTFLCSIYLYSEDSRRPDQSPDAYKVAWDTLETHTAPHLPARLRLALKCNERCRYDGRKSDLAGAGGAGI